MHILKQREKLYWIFEKATKMVAAIEKSKASTKVFLNHNCDRSSTITFYLASQDVMANGVIP